MDKEIRTAFAKIVKNVEIFERYRFCFFIDGLDEFEEESVPHGVFVKRLQEWVNGSAGSLKICVSSREYPVFQNSFRADQRIRLQDLTKQDMEEVVQQRLGTQEDFQELWHKNAQDCDQLLHQITEKSDGVFLWLSLTLRILCEALENGDSLLDLFRKLDSIPQELEEFFGYIINSIRKEDRKKAHWTLMFAIEANKSGAAKRSADVRESTDLSLFQCSFLDDYIDSPEFAKKQTRKSMDVKDLKKTNNCCNSTVNRALQGFSRAAINSWKPPTIFHT